MDSLYVFDVGNSRIKAAHFDGAALAPVLASQDTREACFGPLLDDLGATAAASRAAIATVNAVVSDRLIAALVQHGVQVERVLRSDGRVFADGFLQADVETPETTGVDRVLAVVAALERSPGHAVIVVDCGSAITVNLATQDRVFRGGAIVPGIRLAAEALHTRTAALPEVALQHAPEPVGRSTAAAIGAGLYYGAAGAVDRLIAEMARAKFGAESASPVIHLTGGDAELLKSAMRTGHLVSPHLVLEGLVHVVLGYRKRGDGSR